MGSLADCRDSSDVRFVPLDGEPDADRYIEDAFPGVYDAGRPYVDWFFGGPTEARAAVRRWMTRPSSDLTSST